mgnify:FL=1
MAPEFQNEKFLSLYLEQIVSNPAAIDALIDEDDTVPALLHDVVTRIGDNELEQQSLLRDMFRLVSREGTAEITNIADAMLTLFKNPTLKKIFSAQSNFLLPLYLESIKKQTKENSLYESIDRLFTVGETLARYFSNKKQSSAIDGAWNALKEQFNDPNDRHEIFSRLEGLKHTLSSVPRKRKRAKNVGENIDSAEPLSDREVPPEDIIKAIKEHPSMSYRQLALRILKIEPFNVYYAVRTHGAAEGIEKRSPGRKQPPGRDVDDQRILETIQQIQ